MKETVALVKKKQKTFNSSVKKYKALLKKGDIKIDESAVVQPTVKKPDRGIVYIGNVPHGFFEKQMRKYFKQFGKITRLRLARSKRTGESKGYAFLEFKEPDVAKIVAETMHNYLMDKRLLKAQYIAPENQNKDYFKGKNYTADKYPTLVNRKKNKKSVNSILPESKQKAKTANAMKNIMKVIHKLKLLGIEYDFKPVDVPAYIINKKESKTPDSINPSLEFSKDDDSSEDDIIFTPPEKMVQLEQKTKEKKNQTKQKLVGVAKKQKKTTVTKTSKINDKKISLIKKQITSNDQVDVKTVKNIQKGKKKKVKNQSPNKKSPAKNKKK